MSASVIEINDIVLNELLDLASENEITCDFYDGCLLDNYILYNAECIAISGMSSKYIVVKERYLNEWSSDMVAIMTNSEQEVEKYRNIFES